MSPERDPETGRFEASDVRERQGDPEAWDEFARRRERHGRRPDRRDAADVEDDLDVEDVPDKYRREGYRVVAIVEHADGGVTVARESVDE